MGEGKHKCCGLPLSEHIKTEQLLLPCSDSVQWEAARTSGLFTGRTTRKGRVDHRLSWSLLLMGRDLE